MSVVSSSPAPSRVAGIVAWILQGLLALTFLAAASAKLAGAPMLVDIFEQIGLGQWFRIVTAVVELLGVLALLVPGYAALGALWLGITMVCAALTHVFILHNSPGGPIVLLVLIAGLLWLRRGQLAALRARFF